MRWFLSLYISCFTSSQTLCSPRSSLRGSLDPYSSPGKTCVYLLRGHTSYRAALVHFLIQTHVWLQFDIYINYRDAILMPVLHLDINIFLYTVKNDQHSTSSSSSSSTHYEHSPWKRHRLVLCVCVCVCMPACVWERVQFKITTKKVKFKQFRNETELKKTPSKQ